jgi:hypothetical protein
LNTIVSFALLCASDQLTANFYPSSQQKSLYLCVTCNIDDLCRHFITTNFLFPVSFSLQCVLHKEIKLKHNRKKKVGQ